MKINKQPINMKKITILFIVAIMSVAAGCSGDDTAQRTSEEIFDQSILFGKWKLQSWKIGSQEQDITACMDQHDFWEFFDTDDVNESFGEMISNRCTQELYNHKYTFTSTDFTVRQLNTPVPYQAKFKVTEVTDSKLTVKLYWTSQETPSGGVQEDFIAEAEQPSYTYIKE